MTKDCYQISRVWQPSLRVSKSVLHTTRYLMKETPRHYYYYYYYYYFYTIQSDMITLLLYIIIATWCSC